MTTTLGGRMMTMMLMSTTMILTGWILYQMGHILGRYVESFELDIKSVVEFRVLKIEAYKCSPILTLKINLPAASSVDEYLKGLLWNLATYQGKYSIA